MMASAAPTSDQFCVFNVRSDNFAINATEVREIVEMTPVVSIPHSPSCLAGVCHVRNEFVPVLLLSSILSGETTDMNGFSYLLSINNPHGGWALAISQVAGLERLELAMNGGSFPQAQSPFVSGTANWRSRVVQILDVERLFREAANSIEQAWSSLALTNCSAHDLSLIGNMQTVPAGAVS